MARKIILEGDREAAARLIPAAANVLWKAKQLQNAGAMVAGAQGYISTTGAYARVTMFPGLDVVRIYAPPSPSLPFGLPDIPEFDILSGVVRDGFIVTVPLVPSGTERRLRDYKPTQNAWEEVLDKNPLYPADAFSDIARLAVVPAGSSETVGTSQYQTNIASNYSGTMRTLVQVVLGMGRLQDPGIIADLKFTSIEDEILAHGVQAGRFSYTWQNTHGLVKAQDGVWWIVQITYNNGIFAMPLPLFSSSQNGLDSQDVQNDCAREAADIFGGIPTGECIPTGAALTTAFASGDVIRLATSTDLADFYGGGQIAPALQWGWSFNDAGSEAHNIAIKGGSNIVFHTHGRIAFSIGPINKNRTPDNKAIGNGTAVYTRIEQSQSFVTGANFVAPFPHPFSSSGALGVHTFDVASGALMITPAGASPGSGIDFQCDFPLAVMHINGQLRVLRYLFRYDFTGDSGAFAAPYDNVFYSQGDANNARPGTVQLPCNAVIFPNGVRDGYVLCIAVGGYSGPDFNQHIIVVPAVGEPYGYDAPYIYPQPASPTDLEQDIYLQQFRWQVFPGNTGFGIGKFAFSHSCFGRPHAVHSTYYLSMDRFTLEGPLFAGQTSPTNVQYFFLGYT